MSEETKDDAKEKGIPRYTGQSPKPDTRPRLKAPEPPKPAKGKKEAKTEWPGPLNLSVPKLKTTTASPPAPEVSPEATPQLSQQQLQGKRLETLAATHSIAIATITPAQLARDIYDVCCWMQANKPYNADMGSIETLSKAEGKELKTYWMQHDDLTKMVLDGVIFFTSGSGGTRRRPAFYGWGLLKNPILKSEKIGKEVWLWEKTWLENFGYLNPEIADEIRQRQAAIEEANKRIVTRRHNYFWLENKTTMQVAQLWAVSHMMGMWFWHERMFSDRFDGSGDAISWLHSIWMEQAKIFELELEYRTEADPQPRSSKRKTEAAKEDFRKAALVLGNRVTGLYSQEFIDMVCATKFPFDFSLDPEALPKQRPEKEPVMRMSSSKLQAEFMRWVTDNQVDPDSFEAEDAIALKRRVSKALVDALEDERKVLARAKGQKVQTLGVSDAPEES
jgi:hypothetical protein